MIPKIEVVEELDWDNEIRWTVQFTIGVQGFKLSTLESKEHAQWMANNLRVAFFNAKFKSGVTWGQILALRIVFGFMSATIIILFIILLTK